MNEVGQHDAWAGLRRHTSARIAIGSSGNSLTTAELLRFGVAHAQARDAVHLPLDVQGLCQDLATLGYETLSLESAAPDRATYIRRPDLGRRLSAHSTEQLAAMKAPGCDVLVVIGDGLSSNAVQANAAPLLKALIPQLRSAGLSVGPMVVATQARVALGDPVGEALGGRLLLMLIGERPGLSSPDSLGAYLTWAPRTGKADSVRNCVSNIRPEGLPTAEAAGKLAWLIGAAMRLGATGVTLKDDSTSEAVANANMPKISLQPAATFSPGRIDPDAVDQPTQSTTHSPKE